MRIWEKLRGILCRLGLLPSETGIFYIGSSIVLPPPLTAQQEAEAVRGFQQGDRACRDRLIEHNLRLVVYIARKFENTGIHMEDLISIGTIGLIKAIETYNLEKKTKLATYASRCIENEILMHFRGRRKFAQDVFINDPIDTDKDGNSLTFQDIMTDDSNIYDEIDLRIKSEQLHTFIAQNLAPREREIIYLRYGLRGQKPLTQREVADKLGISRSYVSRIEKKAIGTLKKLFESKTAI